MSESKFTPGPWRIEHSLECAHVRADCPVCAAKGLKEPISIAQMFRTGSDDDHVEHEMANARLIAAAPELYEALRNLLALCESPNADFSNGVSAGVGHPDEGDHWAGVYIDAARAALLKATPEQSECLTPFQTK